MNYSTAVMLFNDQIRAIKTIYEPDTEHKKQQRYIYKTLDTTIKKGDLVVIPTDTRHCYTVVLVDEVDVEVDYESGIEIKWVVSRADTDSYKAVLEQEKVWIDTMKKAEVRKKKKDIQKNVLDLLDNPEEIAQVSNFGNAPALPSPDPTK